MPAAALPALIGAGGAIGSGLLGFFGAKKAATLTPVEQQAQSQQMGASKTLGDQGQMLTGYGMPKLQQAGTYYSGLASGNRAAVGQTLAPDVANINDTYGGTQRTLSRFLKGPDRDYQVGELARQRAGAIGGLFTGARQRGVEGLTSLGQYGVSQGNAALSGAAGIARGVGSDAMQNRYGGAQLQSEAGSSTAALIFQLLKQYGQRGPSAPATNVPFTLT